jgi:alpha-tubulin suppressor-like RCC1 family protein
VNFDNYDLEEPDYGLIIVPILGLSNIITMSVGNQHALFLDADGQVYGMGPDIINPHDVLDNENVSPFLLEIPGDHPIIMIASGIEHSFVMDSSGHVYGFGYNHFGQLGTGDEKIHRFPTLIKDFRL